MVKEPRDIILITDIDWDGLWIEKRWLEDAGYDIVLAADASEETLIKLAPRAALIIVCFAKLTQPVIQAATRARAILRWGVGIDSIDVAQATAQGIPVYNVPDYCIDEVADHALLLMLALFRQLPAQQVTVCAGGWSMPAALPRRLRGLTLGLVGMGRSAQALARRVQPLGMSIIYTASTREAPEDIIATCVADRTTFFTQADCVSLHVPLGPKTQALVNRATLSSMKPSAYLINVARGGLVDTDDLLIALRSGVIAGAGLDVTDPEPLPSDHPLRRMVNCIVTPHAAYRSEEGITELRHRIAQAGAHLLEGTAPPESLVSKVR